MPSLGKDLSKIRSHLGLSIQDIQYATKIPVDTIQSIENDSIFSREDEGKTYIRSFVRSYGRALKIDKDTMIKALDQWETGNYNHLLLQQFKELAEQEVNVPDQQPTQSKAEESVKSSQPKKIEKTGAEKKPESSPSIQKKEANVTEKTVKPSAEEKKPVAPKPGGTSSRRNVDWANMGHKFSEEKKHTPIWIVGLIILFIIAAFAGYLLYNNDYFAAFTDRDSQEQSVDTESQSTQGSLSLNLDEPNQNVIPESESQLHNVELDDVLYITVYAAYSNLDPVRVWSDLKPRLDPYWLEQGVALHFEFQDTIRIRGPYSNLLLFKNGHIIENFLESYYDDNENVIELTRDIFTADSKWAQSVSFELPDGVAEPDSVANRPSF